MGAFQGGLTFRRYTLQGELPADFRDRFQQSITKNIFKPIDPGSEEERSLGWADAIFPLEPELYPERYRFDDYIVLAVRVDTLAVPGSLLKLYTEAECRRMLADQKKEALNRYEKAEAKERVKLELRRKLLPGIKVTDMVWNLTDGSVRYFASADKANMEFMELFELTFELQLIPDSPFTAALHGGPVLSQALTERLERVEPTVFVDADVMAAAMTEV